MCVEGVEWSAVDHASLVHRRMPWSGDSNVMISRFDVRAHLDYIPPFKKESSPE